MLEQQEVDEVTSSSGGQGSTIGSTLFACSLLLVLAIAGYLTRDFPPSVARLPRVLVLLALVPAVVLVGQEWIRTRRDQADAPPAEAGAAGGEVEVAESGGAPRARVIAVAVLVLGQVLLLQLTGVLVSLGVFLLASMSALSVPLRRSVPVTAGLLLLVYVLFGTVLRMPLFDGSLVS